MGRLRRKMMSLKSFLLAVLAVKAAVAVSIVVAGFRSSPGPHVSLRAPVV